MKLGPLARLVEKESQRISSSYDKKSGQAAASNIFGGRQVADRYKHIGPKTTQLLNTPSKSQARCNKSSGILIPAERKVTTAIKVSESESDAEMTDSSDDVPLIFCTRVLRLTASKKHELSNTAEVEGGTVVTEVSADDDSRLISINSEDIEQLHAAYSPTDNVVTEDSIDGGSEAGDCLVSSMLDYISLEQLSNPLTDESPAKRQP